VITGGTCLEYDQLFELIDSPVLQVGDRIKYNNVGAYTLCLTPLFINYFPIVYTLKNEQYKVVRERWTANEFLQKSHI
jgi:diaminopimelate decarboxylase